ncbi:hypothetical protein [Uliginosibacterium flavum]|uniref:Uncharacterized protein n=1 Tax=Uliginosibacterium flavum TaxID=1396831 RepID=A0ABV2TJZ2_9RHOO
MSIQSSNFAAMLLLSEINLQCHTIARAAEKLHESAEHWITLGKGIDDQKKAPPIEIVMWCSACLSAAVAIRRLLFLNGQKNKSVVKKRCKALMDILGNPLLPILSSAEVRNSWEHLDERLDDLLSSSPHVFTAITPIHVEVKQPDPKVFVLRHFDPLCMEIKYGPDTIPLVPLANEVKELSGFVAVAFKRLQSQHCDIYGSLTASPSHSVSGHQ